MPHTSILTQDALLKIDQIKWRALPTVSVFSIGETQKGAKEKKPWCSLNVDKDVPLVFQHFL